MPQLSSITVPPQPHSPSGTTDKKVEQILCQSRLTLFSHRWHQVCYGFTHDSHQSCRSRGAVDGEVVRTLPLGWDEFEVLRVVEGLQFVIRTWSQRKAVNRGSDAHLGGDGARASTSQTDQHPPSHILASL